MERFEYFKTAVYIDGKHARYIDDMWTQNNPAKSFFNRLVDLYCIAPLIGFQYGRKAGADKSEDHRRSIQLEQLNKVSRQLDMNMCTILLLDDKENLSEQERINRAFRGPETKEEFERNVKLYEDYARGGIEVLHEKLIERQPEFESEDERIANIIALYNDTILQGKINVEEEEFLDPQ